MSLQNQLDTLLARTVDSGDLPNLVCVIGSREGTLYEGAFGARALGGSAPMTPDTVVWLASMTKAITTTGVMQLVEQGRLSLDAPASEVVPQLADTPVLTGFDASGKPQLRAPKRAITLRDLLTHSSGLGYEFSSAAIAKYIEATGMPSILGCAKGALAAPLLFDPGERWEYGIGIDWGGQMLEAVSGQTLGAYLTENLFKPLSMHSTGFQLSPAMQARVSGFHARSPEGALSTMPFAMPTEPEFEMGGGALYGTAQDYVRFMRMLLNGGILEGQRVLQEATVKEMLRDQCPNLACGHVGTVAPALLHDACFFPPEDCGWGLSFLINRKDIPGGRAAGSAAWAGLSNVYYWLDPIRNVSVMIGTQILPFFDTKMVPFLKDFEREVYAAI